MDRFLVTLHPWVLFYNRDKLNLSFVEDNDYGNIDNEQNGM